MANIGETYFHAQHWAEKVRGGGLRDGSVGKVPASRTHIKSQAWRPVLVTPALGW